MRVKQLSAGLAVLAAVLGLSVSSHAAINGSDALSSPSTASPTDCDPEAHVCGQWQYAGKPGFVFTGGVGKAHDVFRLGADHDVAYVGVNTRWALPAALVGKSTTDTGNALQICRASSGVCESVKASAFADVTHVVGVAGENLLAEIETYHGDSLNYYDVSYARSADRGRTWSPVPVPENCNSHRSCRMELVPGGDYILLVTETSSQSFDDWATNVYHSNDGGQTWQRQNEGTRIPGTQWSAYAARSSVAMVLGAREHQTAIVNVHAGGEDVVFSDMSSLHGSVYRMSGQGDTLYALVDTGIFPQREHRLYVIRNHAATELWRSEGAIGNVWVNGETIVLHADTKEMVLPAGVFRSVLQVSKDGGKSWQGHPLPNELADSIVDVAAGRIWVVTPKAVWYRDVQ
ncbi:sialidase family protein [Ralstonia mojiangensis]|uniref:sialidase family protein n=1 Tax=Ralstonia mojiangensis TaxID=2953895 RepID=UPI0021B251F5|nr:sialidase family protein [Ralstonia mojiangensis]MCT7325483.1 glycoside hydrolase [Ralstonia mojiangensis]